MKKENFFKLCICSVLLIPALHTLYKVLVFRNMSRFNFGPTFVTKTGSYIPLRTVIKRPGD